MFSGSFSASVVILLKGGSNWSRGTEPPLLAPHFSHCRWWITVPNFIAICQGDKREWSINKPIQFWCSRTERWT